MSNLSSISTKRTGINIATQWIQHIITVFANLFLIAYVVDRVGKEYYGGWTTIASIIGYVSLLDAGLSVAIQHYIASHAARNDKRGMSQTLSSAYLVYGVSACIALLVCLVISYFYPIVFPKIPPKAAAECSQAMIWVAGGTFLMMLNMPIQGTLIGLQRYYLRNINEIITQVLRAGVTIAAFIVFGPSLVWLGLAHFVVMALRFAISVLCLYLVEPDLRFRLRLMSRKGIGEIFSYGGYSAIWTVCNVVMVNSGPPLAVWLLGPVEATYLFIGTRLTDAFGGLVANSGAVFVPIASSLYASGDKERMRSVLIRGTRFSALIALAGAACMILFGRAILNLWVGPGFTIAFGVLVVRTIGRLGNWVFVVPESILMGTRALRTLTAVQLVRATFSIVAGIIGAMLWGTVGLAAGTVLPLLLTSSLWIPISIARRMGMTLASIYGKTLLAPLAITAIVGVLSWSVQRIYPARHVWTLVVEIAFILGVWGLLLLWRGLDHDSRRMILVKLRSKRAPHLCPLDRDQKDNQNHFQHDKT